MTPEEFDLRFQALLDTLQALAQEAEVLRAEIGEPEFLTAKIIQRLAVLDALAQVLVDWKHW